MSLWEHPPLFKVFDTAKVASQALIESATKNQKKTTDASNEKKIVDQVLDLPIDQDVNKQVWLPTYQLIEYSIPCVADYPTINKKFKVHVSFFDKATGKTANKTIFFGDEKDYIFTKNKGQKLKKLASFRQLHNPLSADYWRAHICFGSENYVQNILDLIRHTLTQNSRKLSNLKPKKQLNNFMLKKKLPSS